MMWRKCKTWCATTIVAGIICVMATDVDAAFMTYTLSFTGSGTLGGTAFTNSLLTLTGVGETANVTDNADVSQLRVAATISVAGLATATFTDEIIVNVTRGNSSGGFSDRTTNALIIFVNDPSFSTYRLRTTIGPLVNGVTYNPLTSFQTSAGALILGPLIGPGTFQASFPSTTVPEPSSLTLSGCAMLFGFSLLRFRVRRISRISSDIIKVDGKRG